MIQSILDAAASIDLLHWLLFLLTGGFAAALLILDRQAGNGFYLTDALKDTSTGKASLDKIVVAFFAILSGWAIVYAMVGVHPIPDALVTILGIFVLKTMMSRGIDAKWGAPRDGDKDQRDPS